MDLLAEVARFGARRQDVVELERDDSPAILPYATLQQEARRGSVSIDAVIGVHEWQGQPLVYLVDESRMRSDDLPQLRRRLALRGEAPWLGLVAPGRLTLHRLGLGKRPGPGEVVDATPTAADVFPRLALGFFATPSQRPGEQVRETLRKLLRDGTGALVKDGHTPADAQSLVGRALFTRFLGDRHLLEARCSDVGLEPHALFRDRPTAQATSDWLDTTFNGDLLKPSPLAFAEDRPATWKALGDILHRAPGGQLALGFPKAWNDFDFAHIPLGVLSEAFEDLMADHDPLQQDRDSAHYTPAVIAERMVNEVFAALGEQAHCARVLDPAVGGGVFLLATFRRLVEACWRKEGRRPGTARLRSILYEQLVGFDINEAAIRYAALGLYLLAIELDPAPLPINKLKFAHNLVGRVLFPVGSGADAPVPDPKAPIAVPGSLGPRVGPEHAGQYDLVIGNPPWSDRKWTPEAWAHVENSVAAAADARGIEQVELQRFKPDLPFIWRAMEWARPGGRIALVLHGRLLFQKELFKARNQVFASLDVTGVLNGAELFGAALWRSAAPFLVLFAINRRPGPQSGFWIVSPRWEPELNGTGRLRVDLRSADAVHHEQMAKAPTLPKVLFRGSAVDLEVLQRFSKTEPVGQRWTGSTGYQDLRDSSKVRKGQTEPGYPAAKMLELTELSSDLPWRPLALSEVKFTKRRLHFPRDLSIYLGPKLIVRQSVREEQGRVEASVSLNDLVFSETFYAYRLRTGSTSEPELKALFLQVSSQVALWYLLMTSGKFGFERRVFEKAFFEELPVVALADLPTGPATRVEPLFAAVVAEPDSPAVWRDIDDWAAEIYGLRPEDVQTIADTLAYNLPFAIHRERAAARPTVAERHAFAQTLTDRLDPMLRRLGRRLVVDEVKGSDRSPWEVLFLHTVPMGAEAVSQQRSFHSELLAAADDQAATEILVPDAEGLWLARVARARHWSHNQAILCARNLKFHHLSALVRRP